MIQRSFSQIAVAVIFLASLFAFVDCSPGSNNPVTDPPGASFTYTSARNFPVTILFTNTSISGAPGPSTFVWDFGDGGFSFIQNPSHMYQSAGTYLIKMIQTQSDGTKDTVIMALALTPNGPSGTSSRNATASFIYAIVNDSYTATFTNGSIDAQTYLWEFGDGTTSTSANSTVTKSYTAPGVYHARLTATGQGGVDTCGATISF